MPKGSERFFFAFFFCFCFFCYVSVFLFCFFLQNSKFPLTDIMIACDRTSSKRKRNALSENDFVQRPVLRVSRNIFSLFLSFYHYWLAHCARECQSKNFDIIKKQKQKCPRKINRTAIGWRMRTPPPRAKI